MSLSLSRKPASCSPIAYKQTRAAQEAETSRAQQSKIHAQRLSAAAELQNQEQRLAIADLKQALKRSQQASCARNQSRGMLR